MDFLLGMLISCLCGALICYDYAKVTEFIEESTDDVNNDIDWWSLYYIQSKQKDFFGE